MLQQSRDTNPGNPRSTNTDSSRRIHRPNLVGDNPGRVLGQTSPNPGQAYFSTVDMGITFFRYKEDIDRKIREGTWKMIPFPPAPAILSLTKRDTVVEAEKRGLRNLGHHHKDLILARLLLSEVGISAQGRDNLVHQILSYVESPKNAITAKSKGHIKTSTLVTKQKAILEYLRNIRNTIKMLKDWHPRNQSNKGKLMSVFTGAPEDDDYDKDDDNDVDGDKEKKKETLPQGKRKRDT